MLGSGCGALGRRHGGPDYRRNEFVGLKVDQVKRLEDLETKNQRLRKAIADLMLDEVILSEAAQERLTPEASLSKR